MAQDPNHTWSASHSRRMGIDRRWIPSPKRTPERRRGGDRRCASGPPSLKSADGETPPGHSSLFPEIGEDEKSLLPAPASVDGRTIAAFAPGDPATEENDLDND
jgi:hypothetical protein